MKTYKVVINYNIEEFTSDNEDPTSEVMEQFFNNLVENNQTPTTFLSDIIEIEEIIK